jgi:copper chaperone
MEQLTMQISGMSCGHCVASVERALGALDGVQVRSVAVGQATVAYDPAAVTAQRITAAVTDAGYEARVAEAAA